MWYIYLLVGVITGYMAHRKGYSFYLWFFAGGVLGLVVLLMLPDASDPLNSYEENQRLAARGNNLGWIIVVAALVIGMYLGFTYNRY